MVEPRLEAHSEKATRMPRGPTRVRDGRRPFGWLVGGAISPRWKLVCRRLRHAIRAWRHTLKRGLRYHEAEIAPIVSALTHLSKSRVRALRAEPRSSSGTPSERSVAPDNASRMEPRRTYGDDVGISNGAGCADRYPGSNTNPSWHAACHNQKNLEESPRTRLEFSQGGQPFDGGR